MPKPLRRRRTQPARRRPAPTDSDPLPAAPSVRAEPADAAAPPEPGSSRAVNAAPPAAALTTEGVPSINRAVRPGEAGPDAFEHTPVLLAEALTALEPRPGGRFVDATVGGGGHAAALLDRTAPDGRLLGLDQDPEAVAAARARLARYGTRAVVVHANFEALAAVAAAHGFTGVDGVLFDLGVSSHQLTTGRRGFSFRVDAPLDMRMDPTAGPTAADLVNTLDEAALADLIYQYGEEPRSRAIARAIVRARATTPIDSTLRLAELVARAAGGRQGRSHPATRTFQALRIAVNRELEVLERALAAAVELLRPGGRLAVISFHSLEDRIVKRFIAAAERPCVCPPQVPVCVCGRLPTLRALTRKPVEPGAAEIAANPRSRSARLRAAERL